MKLALWLWRGLTQALAGVLILAILIYQKTLSPSALPVRPCLPVRDPVAAAHMIEALRKYGLITGVSKGIARLRTATPGIRGYDPP